MTVRGSLLSPLPPDLALESLRTWDAGDAEPAVPEALRPAVGASLRERLDGLPCEIRCKWTLAKYSSEPRRCRRM